MTSRYRCTACGNLTRFDVVGELSVEEEQVLDATIEAVVCRWCSASGAAIEEIPLPSGEGEVSPPQAG